MAGSLATSQRRGLDHPPRVQGKNAGVDQPVVKYETLNQDKPPLAFFDAVAALAGYENRPAPIAAIQPPPRPTRKRSASRTSPPSPKREGIVFDIDGKPYPTTPDGRVISDGLFAPENLAVAETAAQARQIQQQELADRPETAFPRLDAGRAGTFPCRQRHPAA